MNKKVVVAMSGGVDSSVAAALLKEQGYDVYGITMKLSNWENTEGRTFGGCCGSKDFYDARSVAQTLGIPHYSFDYVDHFKGAVIDYFKKSYMNAETPNPCIACNQHVKFERLLNQAMALGADYLATGHYARIETSDKLQVTSSKLKTSDSQLATSHYVLKKAVDATKDQSYVLYHLTQEELSHLMFPLGGYSKVEIRELARKYKLRIADKPDSQEICFVPNLDYKQFVEEEIPAAERPTGPIRHLNGNVLGQHRGLPFYTIGQREGLGIAVGRPLYVVALEKESNTVVVGEKEDVFAPGAIIRQVSWVAGHAPQNLHKLDLKIRYKHTGAAADLELLPDGNVKASLRTPQSAITPGQAAVFYDGDSVLGGGVIDHVVPINV